MKQMANLAMQMKLKEGQVGFKMLKDWFSFQSQARRRKKEGIVCVTGKGQACVPVSFEPDTVSVVFVDPDPPIDPCHPHPPDSCAGELVYLGYGRWGVRITWDVWASRQLKYDIEGSDI